MTAIANRRMFLERANALIKKTQPDLHDLSGVCEALALVMSDMLGARARIVVKVDAQQLQKAIEIAESAEKAGAQ